MSLSEVIECCKNNQVQELKKMVETKEVNLDDHDKYHWTGLHFASRYGHMEMVEFMILHGANINCRTMDGETALHLCARDDRVEMINLLLRYGADINAKNDQGETPCFRALYQDHLEAFRVLLDAGSNINFPSKSGDTLLHVAVQKGNESVIEDLLQREILISKNLRGKWPQDLTRSQRLKGLVESKTEKKNYNPVTPKKEDFVTSVSERKYSKSLSKITLLEKEVKQLKEERASLKSSLEQEKEKRKLVENKLDQFKEMLNPIQLSDLTKELDFVERKRIQCQDLLHKSQNLFEEGESELLKKTANDYEEELISCEEHLNKLQLMMDTINRHLKPNSKRRRLFESLSTWKKHEHEYESISKDVQNLIREHSQFLQQQKEAKERSSNVFSKLLESLLKYKTKLKGVKRMKAKLILEEEDMSEIQYKKAQASVKRVDDELSDLRQEINSFQKQLGSSPITAWEGFQKINALFDKRAKGMSLKGWLESKNIIVQRDWTVDYSDKELISDSQGQVWKAKHDGQVVVLKRLSINEINEKRIRNEIKLLLKLEHPNIIPVLAVFFHQEFIFIEMPFCSKGHLFQWAKRDKESPMGTLVQKKTERTLPTLRDIFHQILTATAFLHSQGIEHRDIKPQNILIDETETVFLIDFGLSRDHNEMFITSLGTTLGGTSRYLPPEGSKLNRDIYAIGLMLYELLVDPSHIPYDKNIGFPKESGLINQNNHHMLYDFFSKCLFEEVQTSAHNLLNHEFFNSNNREVSSRGLMDSNTKLKLIQKAFEEIHDSKEKTSKAIAFTLNRATSIIEPMLDVLHDKEGPELLRPFSITFANESGVDQGGLTNDALHLFCKQISKSKYIDQEENSVFYLPTDDEIPNAKNVYESLGKLMCRAMLERWSLRIMFSPFVYCHILDEAPKSLVQYFSHCEDIKPMNIRNLRYAQRFPESCGYKESTVAVELQKIMKKWLYGENFRSIHLDHIKAGFWKTLDSFDHIKMSIKSLSSSEFQLLLCGVVDLNPQQVWDMFLFDDTEWKDHPKVRQWFKKFVFGAETPTLKRLVLFCTGLPAIPFDHDIGKKIPVRPSQDRTYSHTCITVRHLELFVNSTDYLMFKTMMETSLVESEVSGLFEL